MNNVEIVKYIYEKFKHGDAPSSPDHLRSGRRVPPCRGAPLSALRAALARQGRHHAALLRQSRSRVGLVHCTRQRTRPRRYRGGGRPIQVRLQADRQGTRRPDMPRVEVQKRYGQEFPPVRRHGADPGGDDTQLAEVARACVGSRPTTLLNGRTNAWLSLNFSAAASGPGWRCAFAIHSPIILHALTIASSSTRSWRALSSGGTPADCACGLLRPQ